MSEFAKKQLYTYIYLRNIYTWYGFSNRVFGCTAIIILNWIFSVLQFSLDVTGPDISIQIRYISTIEECFSVSRIGTRLTERKPNYICIQRRPGEREWDNSFCKKKKNLYIHIIHICIYIFKIYLKERPLEWYLSTICILFYIASYRISFLLFFFFFTSCIILLPLYGGHVII